MSTKTRTTRTRGTKISDLTEADVVDLDVEEVYIGGQRFTNADAERLADELERHEPAPVRRGRPRLGEGSRAHSPKVGTRVTEADYAAVLRAAQTEGITPSEWVRRAIRDRLAS